MHRKVTKADIKALSIQQAAIDSNLKLLEKKFEHLQNHIGHIKSKLVPVLAGICERTDVPSEVTVDLLKQLIVLEKL